jgi:Cof subfamily protein (haloacid dehalogenase superfamily)
MPHRSVQLVCIDVDGTLVGALGTVDAAIWRAAERLRAAGVRLAVCSGRPGFGDALAYARRLDEDGWHVFQNGASVVHARSGASRSAGLAPGVVPALVAQARRSGHTLELYDDASYVVAPGAGDPSDRARRHAELLGVDYPPVPLDELERAAGGRVVRAQWLLAHDDEPGVLADPVAGTRLLPSTSPVMRETAFVSVVADGVDKVVGVSTVAEAYGVPLAQVMFVGDGANDAMAMAAVGAAGGWPVAMGNSEPEALAAARRVVGDVDAGGLADALALVLGDRH